MAAHPRARPAFPGRRPVLALTGAVTSTAAAGVSEAVRRRRRGRSAGVVGGHAAACGRRRPGPGRRLGRGHRGRRAAGGWVNRTRPPGVLLGHRLVDPRGGPSRGDAAAYRCCRSWSTPPAWSSGHGSPATRRSRVWSASTSRAPATTSWGPLPHPLGRPRPPSTSRWSAWVPAWRRWSPWPVSVVPRSPWGCRSRSVGRGRGWSTADGTGIPSALITRSTNQGSSGRLREAPGVPDNPWVASRVRPSAWRGERGGAATRFRPDTPRSRRRPRRAQ